MAIPAGLALFNLWRRRSIRGYRLQFVVQVEVLFHPKVLTHIAQRLLRNGQLAQVISPGVVTGTPTGIPLAVDGGNGSIRLAPREGLGRHLEGNALACLPEAGGKLMREQERVVTAFGAQHLDRLPGRLPWQSKSGNVPLAKLEAIGSCLRDE